MPFSVKRENYDKSNRADEKRDKRIKRNYFIFVHSFALEMMMKGRH
jgi:hypothetical protein